MEYNQAVKLNCREVFDQLVNFSRHLIILIESASQKPSPWSQVITSQMASQLPSNTTKTTNLLAVRKNLHHHFQRSFSMRFELIALLTLSTCQLALACCGNKDLTSCCGNGKCNIFCCNCDGGNRRSWPPRPRPPRMRTPRPPAFNAP